MKQKLFKTFKLFCRYLFFGLLTQTIFIQSLFLQSVTASVLDRETVKTAEIEISGKVVDENGEPLPGTSITVKGKAVGAVADADGNFKLIVDESAVLIFSFIGYNTIEEPVGGRSVINVTLDPDITTLAEVVVTGYQTLSRERVTGSFETISGEVLAQRPTANLVDKLEGVTSGVAVTNGSVTIRGQSTILANAVPLYVVDGFPLAGSTLTVNPEDIESITILKDAAAASIWGARASNGVIVITTKKGSQKGTKINFSTYVEVTEGVDYSKQNYLSTADEIELNEEQFDKGWYQILPGEISGGYSQSLFELAKTYNLGLAPDGEVWSDNTYNKYVDGLKTKDNLDHWEKHLLQKPVKQTYNFSIASGSENNDIYASLVYNKNLGQSIGNSDDRMVLNFKDEFRLKDRFIFNVGINSSLRNNTSNGYWAGAISSTRGYEELVDDFGRTTQYYNRYHPWYAQEREAIDGYFPYTFNHLDEMRNRDNTRQRIDIRTQFGIGVNIIEGLRIDSKFQYEMGFDNKDNFNTMDLPSHRIFINDFYFPDGFDENGESLGYQVPVGTKYVYNKNKYSSWDWRNTIFYEKSWGVHEINVFAGTEIIKNARDESKGTIYGYDKQTTQYIPINENDYRSGKIIGWNKNTLNTGELSKIENDDLREVSFFSNSGYTFNGKYSVTGSFRIDQKNLFGSDPEFRYKPLWSAGASWQMRKEGFMNGIEFLDRLTLRATYGINGNASNKYSPYAQAENIIEARGSQLYSLLRMTNPANTKLKWEETAVWNIGVDFAVLKNRMSGSIEFYNKNSTDLLGSRPLDPTNGFASAVVNYASMVNTGVDIAISGKIISKGSFQWDARLLFSYNKNEVTDVVNQNIVPVDLAWAGALRVGQPIDNIYSFNYAGLNYAGDIMLNTAASNEPVNWRAYQGNEKEEDLIYFGTGTAPVYGGLATTVNYKGFDLTINASYKFGYHFKHYRGVGVDSYYYEERMNEVWKDRWRKPGDEQTTRIPKIAYDGLNPYSGVVEWWWDNYEADWYWNDSQDNVLDGGFIRIKDIIFGYTLPKKLLQNTPIGTVRGTVQVTNPYTWLANKRGVDPERIYYNEDTDSQQLYSAAWTGLTSITFGLRATF